MSYGVAIDPGLRGCGFAVFEIESRELVSASYVKNPTAGDDFEAARSMALSLHIAYATIKPAMPAPAMLWGECPRSYSAGKQKGDQNDLIHLAGFMYAIAHQFSGGSTLLTRYYPREWKGTIDADQMLDRIIERLSGDENARVRKAGALTHNVIDAVGIGLHALGRLAPKRVFGGING